MKGKRSLGPLLGVTHFSCATTYLVSQPVLYIIFINRARLVISVHKLLHKHYPGKVL